MLVLTGKTASGKDLIKRILVTKYGFKQIVTYTTRPIRKGEKDGITYHYISDDDFKDKIKKGFFAEWKKYNTTSGVWYYGSAKQDFETATDDTVIILTPDGIKDVKNLKYNVKVVYVYANVETISNRLLIRGDDKDESQRRISHDEKDFKNVKIFADTIVENNLNDDINTVIKHILFYYGKVVKNGK